MCVEEAGGRPAGGWGCPAAPLSAQILDYAAVYAVMYGSHA